MRNCIISFMVIALMLSCTDDRQQQQMLVPDGCPDGDLTFSGEIGKIVQLNCNSSDCHAPGGKGSFDFTRYEVLADRARSGVLMARLDLPIDDPQHMPMDFSLSPCDYYKLKQWIAAGGPE